ncbi:MAG TPA: polysaccharide biosynthesis protein [Lachnospiraceae bacterium]|jgi:O-antigen/teichoic acid export membrane protein|nr:polysaccharide biosynthesis protein [Lachnospiraceae bacterium]
MGRVRLAEKNIAFGYIGQAATSLMSFVLRTIFIRNLSESLLGINSTYSNVLSILSMAELGIGTALNFALYKPVAENDTEKIKSYMQMYKICYRVIACVVAAIGLVLVPFLPRLVKNPGVSVFQLDLFYLIFLFNTVSSYFVAYKYSLCNAQQKNYIQTNINTVTKIIVDVAQIVVIIVTKNFLFYLVTDMIIELAQKIFVSWYLNKLYPYLKEKNVKPLSKEESGQIWTKTKALVLHKVGDVARLQTDSLIISSFIEVSVAGFVDNYNLIINAVANFVNVIFNNVISGFGNLIATESRDKQFQLFKVYRFFAVWLYGFIVTGFFVLLTPLIRLWLGDSWVLPMSVIGLILTDLYFKGERTVLSNYKTAAGVFEPDRYLAIIQGVVNLVLSIWLVQVIGLAGIYVGTVISGLIANVTKPFIIYRVCFDRKASGYFIDSVKYLAVVVLCTGLCQVIANHVIANLSIGTFLLMVILITLIYNGIFLVLFGRSGEAQYLFGLVRQRLKKG